MSLERFKSAQASDLAGFKTALQELRTGRKTSHWIWYIFPQLAALGRSSTARFYGLTDFEEACDYLRDPLLRGRLLTAAQAVGEHLAQGAPLSDVMGGSIDSLKLVSSLTLFELAARHLAASSDGPEFDGPEFDGPEFEALAEVYAGVLDAAEAQGFPRCPSTLTTVSGS